MNCVFYSLIKFPSVAALGNMVLKSGTALQSVKNVWWGMVCGGKKKGYLQSFSVAMQY